MIKSINNIEFVPQRDLNDCGLACIRMIMKYYGMNNIPPNVIDYKPAESGISLLELSRIAEKIGFKTLSVRLTFNELRAAVKIPCIGHLKHNHYVVICGVNKDLVYIADPAVGLTTFERRQFLDNWIVKVKGKERKGICLLIYPKKGVYKKSD